MLANSQIFSKHSDIPEARGLFNPENDKDACGVGFVADLSMEHSRKTVSDALEMLVRMKHRGACGCEENTGERELRMQARRGQRCPPTAATRAAHVRFVCGPRLPLQATAPVCWWPSPTSSSLR
jgi:hypothetical protein